MISNNKLKQLSMKLTTNPKDPMKSFQKNLQIYLEQKELTLAELSDLSDISQSTLRNLVYNDIKDCHISNVIKLARALNVSIDELIGAETLSPRVSNILKTSRQLPTSFVYFIKWISDYYYKELYDNKVTEKSIPVMTPALGVNNNLVMTNKLSIIDISDLDPNLIPKIFMGIKMPVDSYVPHYFPGDILLIANDRNPRTNEDFLISTEKNLWIVIKQGKSYYSTRDGGYRLDNSQVTTEVGYIAAVINEEMRGRS